MKKTMNQVISIASYYQVMPTSDGQVILKFQTVVPQLVDPAKQASSDNLQNVIAQDVTIFMSKQNAKELQRLISEFVV